MKRNFDISQRIFYNHFHTILYHLFCIFAPKFIRMECVELKQILLQKQCSCVIQNGDVIRSFNQRGVLDLYALWKEEPDFLYHSCIADKVVGKAAAALMILGKIQHLHTLVISEPALDLFKKRQIRVDYDLLVPHIINRSKTDWCPLEKRCYLCSTEKECLFEIEDFLSK